MGVLDGVRVLEIAAIGPGPFCGMLLADMGADVITVERPAAELAGGMQILNRGKRSIVLDIKSSDAQEVILRLVERSDALIEGMRPGVMERLGLGPDVCLARNPALVYGRMTGWGQYGPLAQAAGHDSNYTALSGALWFAGIPGQPPVAPPTMLGDIGGGALYLALGILAGVLRARADGSGQVVDAAIVDGTAHMMNLLLALYASDAANFSRNAVSFPDASHWAGRCYRCADGKWINIAPLEPLFYGDLLKRLGLDSSANFVKGQMNPHLWPELTTALEQLFASKPRAHWCALLEGTDACFAPVLDPAEAAAHPHMVARGTYATVDGVLQATPAPRFSVTPSKAPASVVAPGQDTLTALRDLGYTDEDVARIRAAGAFGRGGSA